MHGHTNINLLHLLGCLHRYVQFFIILGFRINFTPIKRDYEIEISLLCAGDTENEGSEGNIT
jgi:hypothetical protein